MSVPQPQITWTHPGIGQILDNIPTGITSLLDVGCGRGIIGALCRIYRGAGRMVGIDGFQPYLDFCAQHRLYDELQLRALEDLPLPFSDLEFDAVTCIEVIEHLPKGMGHRLLDELERVGRTVIVTTPTTYFHQDGFDGNPLQEHRSAWSVSDFEQRGYVVRGAGGLKLLGRHVKYVSAAFAPLSRYAPRWSEVILCKRINAVSSAR